MIGGSATPHDHDHGWQSRFVVPMLFAVAGTVIFLPGVGEAHLLSTTTRILIFAGAALVLDLLVGFAGLVSFGHAASIGIGAYTTGILASHEITEGLVALPLAIAAAGTFALVTGIVGLRTQGVYFIMITLAFGQMAFFTAGSLAPYGGDDGLTITRRSLIAGQSWLESDRALCALAYAWLLATYALCNWLAFSPFGRVLRGARENALRVETLGFNVFRYRLAAYVLVGALGGGSGFLLANATLFVSPAYMSWQRSGELLVMIILGGIGTLHGAVLGAATYILVEEVLSGWTEHWPIIFGPLLVAVALFAPGGLLGGVRKLRNTARTVG